VALAQLFEASRLANAAAAGEQKLNAADAAALKQLFDDVLFGILGMTPETGPGAAEIDGLMELVLSIRAEAKARKDFAVSDKIRDALNKLHFVIKDGKEGVSWTRE
jgi:cysteinyl-tRNA synthetase